MDAQMIHVASAFSSNASDSSFQAFFVSIPLSGHRGLLSLPDELLGEILGHLDYSYEHPDFTEKPYVDPEESDQDTWKEERATLCAVQLVNRRLDRIARPLVSRTVVLLRGIDATLYRLYEEQSFHSFVQRLVMRVPPGPAHFPSLLFTRLTSISDLAIVASQTRSDVPDAYIQNLRHLPLLRRLRLHKPLPDAAGYVHFTTLPTPDLTSLVIGDAAGEFIGKGQCPDLLQGLEKLREFRTPDLKAEGVVTHLLQRRAILRITRIGEVTEMEEDEEDEVGAAVKDVQARLADFTDEERRRLPLKAITVNWCTHETGTRPITALGSILLSFYAAAPALRRVTLTRLRNFDEVASEWNALRMPHARQLDLDTAENSFGNSLSFLSRILPSFLNITTLRLGVDFVYSFPSNLARLSRPKVPTLLVQLFEMPMPPSLQRVEVISSDELVYDKSGTEWVQLEG